MNWFINLVVGLLPHPKEKILPSGVTEDKILPGGVKSNVAHGNNFFFLVHASSVPCEVLYFCKEEISK